MYVQRRRAAGIGAHDDADYDALKRFVEDPWMCKETLQIRCQERPPAPASSDGRQTDAGVRGFVHVPFCAECDGRRSHEMVP